MCLRPTILAFGVIALAGNTAPAGEYCAALADQLQPGQFHAAKCPREECLLADVLTLAQPNTIYNFYNRILFLAAPNPDANNSLVVVQIKYLKNAPPTSDDIAPQVVELQRDAVDFACTDSLKRPFPVTRNRYPDDTVEVDLDIYQNFHIANTGAGRVSRRLRNEFHGQYDSAVDGQRTCVSTLTPIRRQQYLFYDRDKVRPPGENVYAAFSDFLAPPAIASPPNTLRRYDSLAVVVKPYQRAADGFACVEFAVDPERSTEIDIVLEDLEEKAAYSLLDGIRIRDLRLRYVSP